MRETDAVPQLVDQHLESASVRLLGVHRSQRHVALHDFAVHLPDIDIGRAKAQRVNADGVDVIAFRVVFPTQTYDGPFNVGAGE